MAPPTRTTRRTQPTVRSGARFEAPGSLVLSRYRLHRPLGTGGFGLVWLARDERLERDVAIKVLPRQRVIGGRFEREARAAARLSHPAIVTLYEAAVDDDAAYLVSELVRGSTVAELLEAGRLSDRDISTIGIALCDALEHAHGQGVVHRDVKPSNILVPEHPSSPTEVAKLTDFGVARLIGGNTLTRTGDVIGTAAYMAPEQAEGREADAAADLYSLALVLYEALTGVNPIATSPGAGRARRLGAHLPPLRRHRRDLPRELGRAVDLALRPRPRERGTVAELRAGLVETLAKLEDYPGVVEPAWPRRPEQSWSLGAVGDRTGHRDHFDPPGRAVGASANDLESPARADHAMFRWPERAPAAAAAAAAAGWLTATAFTSRPLPPVGAALFAGLAVAAFPRIGWIVVSLAAAAGLGADGRPGVALVVLIAAAVPILLLPRAPTRWPLAAAAAALGAVTLAGAWPALAGRARSAWQRAALGAVGWIWLEFVSLIAGHGLYTELPPGIPRGPVWMGSLDQTVSHALRPIVQFGLLAPAVVWGLAAALLPWIMRGPAAVRVILIVVWSAALASTTSTVLRGFHASSVAKPGAVVLGAVAGAAVASIPTLLERRESPSASSDAAAGLA